MRPWCIAAVLLWSVTVIDGKALPSPPDFGKSYHVKGVISLPYAEIKEPFEAWFDLQANSSRIDYYHGQVSTYQLGAEKQWGVSYKITPETTEVELNVMKCFEVNGTKDELIKPQGSLPDTQNFQFLGMEYYGGSLCEVWQNVTIVGHKKNTYTLWVTRPERDAGAKTELPTPLHYEMMGYNSLLGSHYDKYLVDYKEFSTHVDPKAFSLPEEPPPQKWSFPLHIDGLFDTSLKPVFFPIKDVHNLILEAVATGLLMGVDCKVYTQTV